MSTCPHDGLWEVFGRIETLSTREFLLHPTKCRCLLQSYALLRRGLLSDAVSHRSSAEGKVDPLLRVLLHTLEEGERFLKDCTFQSGWMSLIFRRHLAARRQWLINTALPIALSTEILDVHLLDFVVCILTLIAPVHGDAAVKLHLVKFWLRGIWGFADDKGDAEKMQELFNDFKGTEHEEICKLIRRRLSESTSMVELNLAAGVVPAYLWIDPPGFDQEMKEKIHVLSNHQSVVVSIKSMGAQFACKHFGGLTSKEEFTNEAVIQASLRHPNVMHLVWCTRRAEGDTLVMELMDESLGHVIEKRRSARIVPPFSLLAGIDIILQIARGMEYLHDRGIMHRDLKSFNILVRHLQHAPDRDRLVIKIADFGASRFKNFTPLFTTKRVGTSIWRAPEVVDREEETKYTKKADVYSFAIVCSEILTGLRADELLPCSRMSELHTVLREGRRPQLPSSCPPAIASYIKKCWDGDASKRPTFKQICRVFCCFKACLLLEETEVLPMVDPYMCDSENPACSLSRWEIQELPSQGRYNQSILAIPAETDGLFALLASRRINRFS